MRLGDNLPLNFPHQNVFIASPGLRQLQAELFRLGAFLSVTKDGKSSGTNAGNDLKSKLDKFDPHVVHPFDL
ncbi:MAG: hypothetical protein DLM68_17465 [Hyphomicrobiales bacterium]|nr:MAG: hypothetical protein DLM68_17465 [Hyphomicrobiales bacterium]